MRKNSIVLSLSLALGFVMFAFNNCGGSFEAKPIGASSLGPSNNLNEEDGFLQKINGDFVYKDMIVDGTESTSDGQIFLPFVKARSEWASILESYENGDIDERLLFSLWPNGKVKVLIDDSVEAELKDNLNVYFLEFNQKMSDADINIEFLPADDNDEKFVTFEYQSNSECRSSIGYRSQVQKVVLAQNCLSNNQVFHFMLYVLGMGHNRDLATDAAEAIIHSEEEVNNNDKAPGEKASTTTEIVLNEANLTSLSTVYGSSTDTINYDPFAIHKNDDNQIIDLPEICEEISQDKSYLIANETKKVKSLDNLNLENPTVVFYDESETSCVSQTYKDAVEVPQYCDQGNIGNHFKFNNKLHTVEQVVLSGASSHFLSSDGSKLNCEDRTTVTAPALPRYCDEVTPGERYTLSGARIETALSVTGDNKFALVKFVSGEEDSCENRNFAQIPMLPPICENIVRNTPYRINATEAKRMDSIDYIAQQSKLNFKDGSQSTCNYQGFNALPVFPTQCDSIVVGTKYKSGVNIFHVQSIQSLSSTQSQVRLHFGSNQTCQKTVRTVGFQSKPAASTSDGTLNAFNIKLSGDGSWARLIQVKLTNPSGTVITLQSPGYKSHSLGGVAGNYRFQFEATDHNGVKFVSSLYSWTIIDQAPNLPRNCSDIDENKRYSFGGNVYTVTSVDREQQRVETLERALLTCIESRKIWFKSTPDKITDDNSFKDFVAGLADGGNWVKRNSSNQMLISFHSYRAAGGTHSTTPYSLLPYMTIGRSSTATYRVHMTAVGVDGKVYKSEYFTYTIRGK